MKQLKPRVLKREARIKCRQLWNSGNHSADRIRLYLLLNIVLTLLAPASTTLLSALLYLAGL